MMFILFMWGCGASFDADGGVEPTETLVVDGGFEFAETIEKGEILALDMRVPVKSGYVVVGASFDPEVLRLEHFLTYDDGEPRARYLFMALANGTSDILVKMQPVGGGQVELYKRVTVNVGDNDTLF